ncbi:hypothetical protein G6O69_26490 [Pseudenhygromyxa sp. WMMC2535]|uniref:hypothetical protein n=1 Tax=Pseudenhygromyxa sp. WMMC2535 TaxID=2712867 RepID=UPI001555C271|nr:hypothetical protein [Pseudenhygromyxa sp. WMMC2535]NVB41415.1 hypothetical protein [Pseudenhygromyxa sp. WMMC2535]
MAETRDAVADEFRRRKAHSRLQEAQAALAREDWAVAEQACAHAVRLDPGEGVAWELWAESLGCQGKLVEAARVLDEALARHAQDPALALSWARAQLEIGQFAAAEPTLRRLCSRWPEQRAPLAHLARLLRDTRAYDELARLLAAAVGEGGAFAEDRELLALLEACRRWQSETPEQPSRPPQTMRERLLERYGVAVLGTGYDDGFAIPWYSTYLCSNDDVVVTCGRLLAFAEHLGWRWQAVVAVDPPARVLAEILAGALGLPRLALEEGEEGEPGQGDGQASAAIDPETTLAVAAFVEPGWQTRSELAWRCAQAGNLFAFGALDYGRHREDLEPSLPPILGVAAGERVCLPWWRLGEARIGFSRFGLIDDLPAEVDGRPPEKIAADYRARVVEYSLAARERAALRELLARREALFIGLRQRSAVARIVASPSLPDVDVDAGGSGGVEVLALDGGSRPAVMAALARLERARPIDAASVDALARRFVEDPALRPRLADLLYRAAPRRLTELLVDLVARPEDEVPWSERDGLLHLLGCDPWGSRAGEQLRRWMAIGSPSNRSEIVQSKYGLHHLAEAGPERFADQLRVCFADTPAVVLGTLRWLHDNPAHHRHAHLAAGLLDHEHADVVFEALQCTRVAGFALDFGREGARLDALLGSDRLRLRAAAIEHLELLPPAQTRAVIAAELRAEAPLSCWAAARTSIRAGSLAERVEGGREVARRVIELCREGGAEAAGQGPRVRQLLRALASAEDFEVLAAALAVPRAPALLKIFAAASLPALLGFDDPRLLAPLRAAPAVFGLDPPRGYARFLLRHGDPSRDSDAVYGAQGARDLRAGYEAKAALARWGDADARAELERATSYAPPLAAAALEAWFGVLGARDFDRLEHARAAGGELADAAWAAVQAQVAEDGEGVWSEALASWLRADTERSAAWADFIESRLRGQLPAKFVVAAISGSHEVYAALLPERFEALVARSLDPAGVPDRLSVDLLEWLAVHDAARAGALAERLGSSPHWGVRQAARRVLDSTT